MKNALTAILLLIAPGVIAGIGEPAAAGARMGGMANAGLVLPDIWTSLQNQAALGWLQGVDAGVTYDNRYLMAQLSSVAAVAAMEVGNGAFGFNYSRFGYSAYREQKVGLAYGRKLSENFTVGVQLDYLRIALGGGYGSTTAFTWEGGMQYAINKHVTLAAHVFNPIRVRLAEFNDERIPATFKFGGSYRFSDRMVMLAQLQQTISEDPVVSAGLEYMMVDDFYVRAGVAGGAPSFAFGAGYAFSGFSIDISSNYHQVLGFTPQLTLTYRGE
ncbi:MAG: hypothetical protein RL226_1161 [Bacteroidota bacterium]|jgi:hypothetical protein